MKKTLVTTALVACATVVLTFMNGLAQAQGPTEAVEQAKGTVQAGITPQLVNPNQLFTGECRVGPRNSDVIFVCGGFVFPSRPFTVFCQTRNSPAQPTAFRDQFACQVVSTTLNSVTVRIRRIDDGADGGGWGQDLRLDLLMVAF